MLFGLGRQIALSMVAIAFGVALLILSSSYLFYFAWESYWPQQLPTGETWIPSVPEWIWMISTTTVGLLVAVAVAAHLTRRILVPLNSVADSIRKVSSGDLSARALVGDPFIGEASALAQDFNTLACKLQRMTDDQRFWGAAIAHELRTPVTILKGRLQGLADGIFTPDEFQFRSLLRQVEGLARLIEDLRAVSLAESGHLQLHIEKADLTAEIVAVSEIAGPGLAEAGQHVVLNLEAPHVKFDSVRLRQALLALFENVRKHACPGQVTVFTRVVGERCVLGVEDSGPGIPKEFMPFVFTAFRRAEGSPRDGSGLGLAMVAAIAHAHKGSVDCRASRTGGTIFELEWPCQ